MGSALALALACASVWAAEPDKKKDSAKNDTNVVPVKQEERLDIPQAAPQAPAAAPTPAPASTSTPTAATFQSAPAPTDAGPAANSFTSGNIAAQPSADLGHVFTKIDSSTGIELQRRNNIIADPRIRGYRSSQYLSLGDHALFVPARLDLDTAISKYDPGIIQNITVIRGPYATRFGPGFAFLDVISFDSPRATGCCDWEMHGWTSLGYQTNGDRWNGLQSIDYGARDWGFRLTYNVLAGNDYRAPGYNSRPDGIDTVPGSYNSQNFSFALGFDLSPTSSIEFKALRIFQRDLEFPGMYFDIDRLDTEAYSMRWTVRDNPYFDVMNTDLWYNYTVVDGSTSPGYKQAYLSRFLPGPSGFGLQPFTDPALANNPNYFPVSGGYLPFLTDRSTTRIAQSSLGFRSGFTWGRADNLNVTAGVDFAYVAQGVSENIRILQPAGPTGLPPVPTLDGASTIQQFLSLPNGRSYNPGLFLESNLPVGDRLSFRTGARVDYVGTTSDPRLITGNIDIFGGVQTPGIDVDPSAVNPQIFSSDPTQTDLDRNFGLWAAFLTSEYKYTDDVIGSLGFGYAMRAPNLYELYATGPFMAVLQPGFNRLIGDPNLDPEKLMQLDAGVRYDYRWIKGSLNVFYAWINDYITYDLNKSGPGITQVIYTNTDRATLAGGEAYTQMEATSWLTPFYALSYVQGRDLTHNQVSRLPGLVSSRRGGTATEPLPNIPPLEMRYGVRLHQAIEPGQVPKYSIEFGARSVFNQGLVATSLRELETGGFTIVDIRCLWQVTEKWLVTAGVENVGDVLYREHLDSRAGDLYYRPGTNFYFGTQVKY
jgi:outer membrane receptor protein involved in Fe transport